MEVIIITRDSAAHVYTSRAAAGKVKANKGLDRLAASVESQEELVAACGGKDIEVHVYGEEFAALPVKVAKVKRSQICKDLRDAGYEGPLSYTKWALEVMLADIRAGRPITYFARRIHVLSNMESAPKWTRVNESGREPARAHTFHVVPDVL